VIRVLHISGTLDLDVGGPRVSILNFCAAGIPFGIEPLIVVPVGSTQSPVTRDITRSVADVGGAALPFSRIGFFKSKASRWGISPGLAWWVLRHAGDFDLVVLHGAWLFSSVAGLAAALFRARPCIMIPHESLTHFDVSRPGNRFRILLKSALKRVYGRYCRLVIFASERERYDSVSRDWRADTVVLYHAIADPAVTPQNGQAARRSGSLRLGFLGRLHEKKNVDRLLQTLAALPAEISLVIGGDGAPKLRAALRALAKELGLSTRVSWLGWVGPDDKNSFFTKIDVLVMPSAYESFGLVAAEAMVRGVPAIVSPTTGIAEIIGAYGGGIVAKPEELREVISTLNASPEKLEQLSREALEGARKALSLSTFGLRLKAEYLKLLAAQENNLSP
jgi:glycosyltransferase involved in cell wall biosynthesis